MIFTLVLALALPQGSAASPNKFLDMAGRATNLTIPVKSVYSTSPVGEIFMYTLAPDLVKGMCWTLRPREIPWLLPAYTKLPVLGGWFGKSGSANLEEIIRVSPEAILSIGLTDTQSVASADKIESSTSIPVLIGDGALGSIDSTYRFLGRILARQARADTLAKMAERILTETVQRRNARKGTKAWKVYYAEGLKGLETDPAGSPHTELLDWLGLANVADVPLLRGYGRSRVSMEQLLAWDPDWILVGEDHNDGPANTLVELKADPLWKQLRAVKQGRIVRIPDLPFNWFDRPPGPARLMGLLWLETVFFPEQMPRSKFVAEMARFFPLFYHRTLTNTDREKILEGAMPSPGANR